MGMATTRETFVEITASGERNDAARKQLLGGS
jgi:hypothetical protein